MLRDGTHRRGVRGRDLQEDRFPLRSHPTRGVDESRAQSGAPMGRVDLEGGFHAPSEAAAHHEHPAPIRIGEHPDGLGDAVPKRPRNARVGAVLGLDQAHLVGGRTAAHSGVHAVVDPRIGAEPVGQRGEDPHVGQREGIAPGPVTHERAVDVAGDDVMEEEAEDGVGRTRWARQVRGGAVGGREPARCRLVEEMEQRRVLHGRTVPARNLAGVSTSKERVIRLVGLERELRNIPDVELAEMIDALPEELRALLNSWVPAGEPAAAHITSLRGAVQRGRLKGAPEKVADVLTAACLQDCIEALGDNADFPSIDDLRAVVPGVVERHGVRRTRLMMASAVVGEAPASPAIIKVLKTEPALAAG